MNKSLLVGVIVFITLIFVVLFYPFWQKTVSPTNILDRSIKKETIKTPETSVLKVSTGILSNEKVSSFDEKSEDTSSVLEKNENLPEETTPESISTRSTLVSTGTTTSSWTNLTEYWNEPLGYGFSVPKGDYYMGGGSRDGAAHSVAIKSGTGVSDFETSDVKVFFYPKTLLPELSERTGGFFQDISTNTTYLQIGSGSLRIDGDINSKTVNTIISTVYRK